MKFLDRLRRKVQKPYLCPVCQGKGIVPRDFYDDPNKMGWMTLTFSAPPECKTCKGEGIVWG
jgi:predicted methyltransferase